MRASIPPSVQSDVLIRCKRRCALCFGLDGDDSQKKGQIAHINGDHADPRIENLVFLCLDHHDTYDSKTKQTKNITPNEVRAYRDQLNRRYAASAHSPEDVQKVRDYLRQFNELFNYIFAESEELAFKIDHRIWSEIEQFLLTWNHHPTRSFDSSVRTIQDTIAFQIQEIFSIYDISMYDWVGNWIRFDNANFKHEELTKRRAIARAASFAIAHEFRKLEQIAVH